MSVNEETLFLNFSVPLWPWQYLMKQIEYVQKWTEPLFASDHPAASFSRQTQLGLVISLTVTSEVMSCFGQSLQVAHHEQNNQRVRVFNLLTALHCSDGWLFCLSPLGSYVTQNMFSESECSLYLSKPQAPLTLFILASPTQTTQTHINTTRRAWRDSFCF